MKILKKRLIIVASTICIVVVFFFYLKNRPTYLASSAELIPAFFSLPKSEIFYEGYECRALDELHSQGRKFEDFGSAYYELRINELHPTIRRKMRDRNGTIDTGHSLILTVKRGNILGTFELLHNSSKAYVNYVQIYDD